MNMKEFLSPENQHRIRMATMVYLKKNLMPIKRLAEALDMDVATVTRFCNGRDCRFPVLTRIESYLESKGAL
jgi:plasmid maintenance system antidote protein VapI